MFISILNDAFSMVRANPEGRNNDYEIVDYILEHFKGWFKHRRKKPQTLTQKKSKIKLHPKANIIKVAEFDEKRLRKHDAECLTECSEEYSRVTFEKTFNIMGNKELYAVDSTNTLMEDLFNRFDYILNESKLDNEISETIDQIFDKDLFKKFIDCMKIAHYNKVRKTKLKR
ncbi:uncharacterized protein LOC124806850 [Hydra vulgaris]|uniref:uncharacterized protein LOC124806850 n=1 Tax=Hydra vulgaris TaxID=6087 RepID=UPI001F5F8053|nr:uncharacterized protein LOC124806850 [Hydra vulgaris]